MSLRASALKVELCLQPLDEAVRGTVAEVHDEAAVPEADELDVLHVEDVAVRGGAGQEGGVPAATGPVEGLGLEQEAQVPEVGADKLGCSLELRDT